MFFRSPAATTGPVGWPVGDPPAGSRLIASTAPEASSVANLGSDHDMRCGSDRDDAHRNRRIAALDHPKLEITAGGAFARDMRQRNLGVGGVVDGEVADIAAVGGERGDQPQRLLRRAD